MFEGMTKAFLGMCFQQTRIVGRVSCDPGRFILSPLWPARSTKPKE